MNNFVNKVSRPLLSRNVTRTSMLRVLASTPPQQTPRQEPPQPKTPKNTNTSMKYGVLGTLGVMMLTGYILKRRRERGIEEYENLEYRKNVGELIRSKTQESEEFKKPETLRERYNFINTVVKQCAPAVFYLEIRDPNKKDVDGKPLITSNGSGFIISEDGWALTNAHVILNKPHSIINAILRDGKSYPVTVEDVDMNIDLALLKLEAKDKVPSLKFGEGDIAVGEWVVALGSPLSLSNSVTVGIISCVNRPAHDLGLKNYSMSYIQTDAAITFGNSGGPLVNLDGNVIGINNLRLTSGISFAIPVEYAKRFLENTKYKVKGMRSVGPMGKSLFGITTISITPEVVKELQRNNNQVPNDIKKGLLIWKIVPGTAGAKGGLKVGDIITHINGVAVTCPADLYGGTSEKKTIELELIQQGKKVRILIQPEMFDGEDW
ncbi:unnamed protein product [Psylliodes chrysocephalus]|uniref:Serine protease HTRA2, mitochondrial n=1 Tax=Psylliodes chrysocephalus TaxID=3402493 RepID=A0A9P0G4K8_9CUCU|nr:unnamed protein product [Psylliodes chrysocephala]